MTAGSDDLKKTISLKSKSIDSDDKKATPKDQIDSDDTKLFTLPPQLLTKKSDLSSEKTDKFLELKRGDDHLVEDGVVVPRRGSVISIGAKVGTEFSRKSVEEEEVDESMAVGRKSVQGQSSTSQSLQSIRRRFGFSWKRYGRKISLFILVFGVIGILATSFVAAWLIDQYDSAKSSSDLLKNPDQSSVIYARDGVTPIFQLFAEEKREVVALCDDNIPMEKQANCVPKQMQLAVVALEDERFYYNENGIPWTNLVGAASKCLLTGGDECRGASGLSQQLVKNLTGEDEFSVDRKIRELFTAMKMNQETNHTDILNLYLNTVPFGRNAYGVQEAAKSYYDKDIKNISTPEACYLAALVQQPSTFSTAIEKKDTNEVDAYGNTWKTHWETFEGRKNICLQKMHDLELEPNNPSVYIQTEEELVQLKSAEVKFAANKIVFKYPHFVEYVREELKKIIPEKELYTEGYKIITTIDPAIQEQTEAIVAGKIESNVLANGANNTAAIVLDHNTGEIIAMVGSRDYNNKDIDGQVNIVTSPQQPGSSIKPYVYAAALSKDFNPGTVILDKVTDFGGGYKPTNYGGQTGYGLVTIRYALQNSLNISAVKAAAYSVGNGGYDPSAGINEVFNFAEKTGLQFPCQGVADGEKCDNPETAKSAYRDRCFLSAALGGCEVTMISHATGTNTLLNDGNLRTATPFISIEKKNDKQENESIKKRLEALYPKKDAAIDPLIARQIANIMSDYNARLVFGPFRYNLELEGWGGSNAVAAKTGTSNDVRDVWTIGGSPYYTALVWVGNTDNSPMSTSATSANSAGGIWKDIMVNLHNGKEPRGFSTEGLRSYPVNCTGTSSGWCKGSELMTEGQIRALQGAQKRMTSEGYDPMEKNIFDYRDEVITRKVKVNKIDGKLAVAETPASVIEERECVQVVSAFPKVPGWYEPAKTFKLADESKNCPTENTEMTDEITPMTLNGGNLNDNVTISGTINISATPTSPGGAMTFIKIFADGQLLTESGPGQTTLTYNVATSGKNGIFKIDVVARDSYGQELTLTFVDVQLKSNVTILTDASNVLNIKCTPGTVAAGSNSTCVTTLPPGYILPSDYKITIGTGPATVCGLTCTVPTAVADGVTTSNSTEVKASIGAGVPVVKGTIILTA